MTERERKILEEAGLIYKNASEYVQVTAKWVPAKIRNNPYGEEQNFTMNGSQVLKCSACGVQAMAKEGNRIIMTVPTPYCPFCGAKMIQDEVEK